MTSYPRNFGFRSHQYSDHRLRDLVAQPRDRQPCPVGAVAGLRRRTAFEDRDGCTGDVDLAAELVSDMLWHSSVDPSPEPIECLLSVMRELFEGPGFFAGTASPARRAGSVGSPGHRRCVVGRPTASRPAIRSMMCHGPRVMSLMVRVTGPRRHHRPPAPVALATDSSDRGSISADAGSGSGRRGDPPPGSGRGRRRAHHRSVARSVGQRARPEGRRRTRPFWRKRRQFAAVLAHQQRTALREH